MVLRCIASRQQGQVVLILALMFTALLGITGVAIDLGFAYALRRQVENAADAAALAGAQALSRHIVYAAMSQTERDLVGLTSDPYPTSDTIWQDMTIAASANVPSFTDLGSSQNATPAWASGTGNSLIGYYMVSDGASPPTISQGDRIDGSVGVPPANAVGVRVEGRLRYATLIAQVLGTCCDRVDVFASARAMLERIGGGGAGESGPFIMCTAGGSAVATPTPGPSPTPGGPTPTPPMGAWRVGPTPSPTAVGLNILLPSATPAAVDVATYAGQVFRVHDPNLDNNNASCGAGDAYKGLENPSDTCDPPGQLPCTLDGQPGTRAGPTRNLVNGLDGCSGTTLNNCVVSLGIASNFSGTRCNNSTCPFTIVTYACFRITEISANAHDGTLLSACTTNGQSTGETITPGSPGAFTYKLVPDS